MSRGPSAEELQTAGRSGDPVELTRALVAIPSVNPALEAGGSGEGEVARVCADWLREWGFRVEWVEGEPGRPSVVARLGHGSPRTILNGHTDTVGVEGMVMDPFDPVLREGRILGRGSCDMKGGLAAILAAAHRLAADPDGFPGELVVVFTADEEHASLGLKEVLDGGLAGDRAVVTEPTELAICPANKGFLWVKVEVDGRAAHGSRPDRGVDAIRGAGRLLSALDVYELELTADEPHALLGHGSIHAGSIRGGGSPSIYPDACELVLEARTLPGEDPEQVLERLGRAWEAARRHDPKLRGRMVRDLFRPGAEVAPDHALVRNLRAVCEVEGVASSVRGMSAWVEAAWFVEAGIPAVCFGPGSIELAHTAEESVSVAEIRQAARVLEQFVRMGTTSPPGRADDRTTEATE